MTKIEFRDWVVESIKEHGSLPPNFDHALSKLIKFEINRSNKRIIDNVETIYRNANNLDYELFEKWYLQHILKKIVKFSSYKS